MNIVFISNEYPTWAPGGKGTFIQTIARELVLQKHQVTVLGIGVSSEKIMLNDEGVQCIRLRKPISPQGKFIENFARIRAALRSLQKNSPIDIVETSELDCAYLPKNPPYKKVIRLHGGHHFFAEAEKRGIDTIKGKRELKSFKNTDAFIAVSGYVRSHTATMLNYGNALIETINYPVDTDIKVPDVTIDANVILFAGTLCEKKGVRELIDAFQLVRKEHPEKSLHLYGRDWFFPDGSSYIDMLKKEYTPEMRANIIFHGSVSRDILYKAYAAAALCVFPSHMETQGLVVLEALLMKRPVVFSEYGPGPETIIHGEDGLLCDVYDPNDIATKINRILNNPEAAQKMGDLGRKRVQEKFEKGKIVSQNLKFYKNVKLQ